MSLIYKLFFVFSTLLLVSACNSVDRFSILKKCTTLGDESIVYARAHYVKLFYYFNPKKFETAHEKVGDFDAITLKNTIDTYLRAVDKIHTDKSDKDQTTQKMLTHCKNLAEFSMDFVENIYPRALQHDSSNDPNTDTFFIEINQLVKFDHAIGDYDDKETSFKQNIDSYKNSVTEYINHYRKNIPSEFVKKRLSSSN